MNTLKVAEQELETMSNKIYNIVLPFYNGFPNKNEKHEADLIYKHYVKMANLINSYKLRQATENNIQLNSTRYFVKTTKGSEN